VDFWVSVGAWIAAAVVAVVVLGYCAYEITWKTKRLQADLRKLQDVNDQLAQLQTQIAATQQRVAATGLR
jgi:outer membrane murein-binding lipoprotein Lpp